MATEPKRTKVERTAVKGALRPMLESVQEVLDRLNLIFPVGHQFRPRLVSQPGARTVFVALYTGSVTMGNRWISPKHIVWMGNTQASDLSDEARDIYSDKPTPLPDRWYKENSRELRDTVISKGLLACGAMEERPGLPITSSLPRYALDPAFAAMFEPHLTLEGVALEAEIWRTEHTTRAAIMRIDMARRALTTATQRVRVDFPSGGGTVLSEGPSSAVIKAVVEEFGPRFLADPHVLWISDSRHKTAYRNEHLERSLGITIDQQTTLPDLIMVDLKPPGRPTRVLVVFVEAVASDGPMDEL